MKIAYFDCSSGISGDMAIGALLDAGLDFRAFEAGLEKLNIPDISLSLKRVERSHVSAAKFDVADDQKRLFRHLHQIQEAIDKSHLDPAVKAQAQEIFLRLAQAEARVHNKPVAQIHFHEIGVLDTIVDVVGTLVALRLLNIERVYASKLNVGTGFVKTVHGTLPVPAPATAELLKGVATYATDSQAELVTPTGAALISTLAYSFGEMPEMTTAAIGYGAGAQELEHPNLLRVFIGDSPGAAETDSVAVIETNIDDMNPQLYESVFDALLEQGALDIYLTNIQMKKGRPGIKLTVLCKPDDERRMSEIILKQTTSIGLRIRREHRRKLERQEQVVDTEFGSIRFKLSMLAGKIVTAAPEYDDCKKAAVDSGRPLKEVMAKVMLKSPGG